MFFICVTPDAPPAPINVVAIASAGAVCLSWESWAMRDSPDVVSYNVKAIPENSARRLGATVQEFTINATNSDRRRLLNAPMKAKVSGLANNYLYKFTITTNTEGGQSKDSYKVEATPQDRYPPCGIQ